METSELFKKVIFEYLKGEPRGAQKELAEKAGIDYKYLNDFLKDRRAMIEQERIKVASALGMTYLEILNLGHKLLTGSEPTPLELPSIISSKAVSEKLQTLNQADLKLINELVDRLTTNKKEKNNQ